MACRALILFAIGTSPAFTRLAAAQSRAASVAATRENLSDLRLWDQQIDSMVRSGNLRVRETMRDTALAERRHERLDQYVRGVRIVGGELTRQTANDGTISLFGTVHQNLSVETTPQLDVNAGGQAIAAAVSGEIVGSSPELVVLPLSDGYHLAYFAQARTADDLLNVYVDASTGRLLQQYSEYVKEVGIGKGAYGDDKKISTRAASGAFVTNDVLRPGEVTTYDMKGSLARTQNILNRFTTVAATDVASDTDNQWTDSNVVDAHVYAGWYYDFLFRRFGRNGLDDRNLRMAVFTHPVRLADIATASPSVLGTYYLNAFSCGTCGPDGRGAIMLGEGAPRGFVSAGVEVKPFSASFDVVGHELTHSVIATSSRLNGFPLSDAGALNEGFADIFGIAAAFFQFPAGNGPMQASYLQGRDLTVPAGVFSRSLSNPPSTGDADHYVLRNLGGDPHYNGVIAGHAFYLAVEGGTNRTSGLLVTGVGASNRDQIEKAFFRAVTLLMPSSSTFALARLTTIQAARDLYGAGSAAERSITQAWDAVGVQPRTVPTATAITNPETATIDTALTCGANPSWILYATVSAGSSNLRITGYSSDDYNAAGTLIDHSVYSLANYASNFSYCGPGSTNLAAQTDACAAMCWYLNPGVTAGSSQLNFTAVDDQGRTITFSTPRVNLR
jgi:thermolysin